MRIDNYRQEHKEIFNEIKALAKNLYDIKNNMSEIKLQFKELSVKLKEQLAKESKLLYPAIINCEDESLTKSAISFQHENINISDLCSAFFSTWEDPQEILDNKKHFISDFKGVVQALGNSIILEETELYPKIEEYFKLTS